MKQRTVSKITKLLSVEKINDFAKQMSWQLVVKRNKGYENKRSKFVIKIL